jgi:hypothetical protein
LGEGFPEALANGWPREPRMRTVAMMPVLPAFEGVENQQADKQGQNDQREIEDGRGIAEKIVDDILAVTTHTASAQYPQPPRTLPFLAWFVGQFKQKGENHTGLNRRS